MNSTVKEVNLNQLWLQSLRYDLSFFHGSAFFCLAFLIPWYFWEHQATVPIYNTYLLFFGIPHNFLTWASFVGKNQDKDYRLGPVRNATLVCGILCLIMYLYPNSEAESWILSVITYASLWHAYRQHHGICKIYDSVQTRRTGDAQLFKDRSLMNTGFGLCIFASLVWLFTHERVEFLLSAEDTYALVYPRLPWDFFVVYLMMSVLIFLGGLYRVTVLRRQKGLWIPWPQIFLMLLALSTYSVPFILLPIEALPVGVAIATMFHNIQYFAFVWMFEKTRGNIKLREQTPLRPMERWAVKNHWPWFLGVAFLYSLFMVGVYGVSHSRLVLSLIYFLAFAHYIVDGMIWTSGVNKRLAPVINSWASP